MTSYPRPNKRSARLFALACGFPLCLSYSGTASACSTVYTVHLEVELSPELAKAGDNILIELRNGRLGRSSVSSRKEFRGRRETIVFPGLCAGSYFVDIGNGELVAVGPVHAFDGGSQYDSTIRATFSKGNVATRRRSEL